MRVPAASRTAIAAVLQRHSDHAAMLPDLLPLGRVVHLWDRTIHSRELMHVLAGHDDEGYFLDYFRDDSRDPDRGFSTSHQRIRDTGTLHALENFQGEFDRRVFDDPERERQRIIAHNARVTEVLRRKGFR